MQRVHLLITGRVQGVWYRASAREAALSLGLVGWVRNRRDGRVELVAEGPRNALDALIAWAWQGPPAADVADVAVTWADPTSEFEDFEVRPSA